MPTVICEFGTHN